MCRGFLPDLPWAAGLAKSAPRRALLACRVPPVEPSPMCKVSPSRQSEDEANAPKRLADSPVTPASSLILDIPERPARSIRKSEGIAFTAVSPLY
ncbi:hypothetical protein BSF38_05211 [Paludisphaera borealis]|uniref:Uncharacterized protein n=1 Tax=Paludisphaera borealis TaxID=1387353 RepID=A0A1U7CXG6_9BACT|nr:hypothetical protein BSF38_05211 [Paludisphaera borealis]